MDIDKVIKGLEHHGKGGSKGCLGCPYELTHGCQLILCHDALALIKEQEAVVRCKDCEWYDKQISLCDNCGLPREQTFFCADGKRRIDDD